MGRGRSKVGGGSRGGGGALAQPVNPIADPDFDVTKQKPTNASFVDNMNEAQLLREIAKMERREASANREADAAFNSGSVQRFNQIAEQFPGGVGGSAVTPAYRRMVERAGNQMTKGVEARERAQNYAQTRERYQKALNDVKGSGLLVHEARTARAAVGGKLDGKWTKTDHAYTDRTFGRIPGQKNGEFTIGKSWAQYYVYRNGRAIGSFKKAGDAKKLIEKYANR